MSRVRRIAALAAAMAKQSAGPLIASLALLLVLAASAAAQVASLAGTYDGGQMEIAAGLELKADGRFRYALSYGALDEEAAGSWRLSGDRVLLTSDPVTPPRFVLVSRGQAPPGILQLSLDVPKGLSRQYFDADITTRDGATHRRQFAEEGLSVPFSGDDAPISVRLVLPVFGVVGEPVTLDASTGYAVRLRFEPHDIGKVDFRATPMTVSNGALVLERHGRMIRFRRSGR